MNDFIGELSIFEACAKTTFEIPGDFGGGSPVPKTFIMAYLVMDQKLKSFVEIGVYRGRSLFPVAYSIHRNGGQSIGVDPYSLSDAKENDVTPELRDSINHFLEQLDFDDLYKNVLAYKESCGFGQSISLSRETSQQFFQKAKVRKTKFDIAHIDGNHDTEFVKLDFENCVDSLVDGGFIVFDDIDWPSVRQVYDAAKSKYPTVFETTEFGILLKEEKSLGRDNKVAKLAKKLDGVYQVGFDMYSSSNAEKPTVAVGILTYNQRDYIEECLNSVFGQFGEFTLKVYISDDCSDDGTSEFIEEYISALDAKSEVSVEFHRHEKNQGMVKNLAHLIGMLGDSDFFTFCEGDDYYLSGTRIAEHLKLLERHPEFALTFNTMLFYYQNSGQFELPPANLVGHSFTTDDLAKTNFIGNLNVSFYRSSLLKHIRPDLFEFFTGDWMLNLFLSQYGTIGVIHKPLNVYRKHDGGIWSGKDPSIQLQVLLEEIDNYNRYLNYFYDRELEKLRNLVIQEPPMEEPSRISVAILDDVSPHPISGFRYQEFTSILKTIPRSQLLTTGESAHVLGLSKVDDLIIEYKRKFPEFGGRVWRLHPETPLNADLLYCDFLGNAFHNVLPIAERDRIPFAFTLYPGGLFALNNPESDQMLAQVTSSRYFKKVVVTQEITRDYLLEKKFAKPSQIELIWGVVVPEAKLGLPVLANRFGLGKDRLDIGFVAHRYTKLGADKGYDKFIMVAKLLSVEFENIYFHVVGPWDKNIINVDGIKNIEFHGVRDQDWFDTFYSEVDLILSPNTDGLIFKGGFDGFPTGAVTDAALRKVAMFVTDPLAQNRGRFEDGKDIVIINNDPDEIYKRIKYFMDNPTELMEIGGNGYKKANELYSIESQVAPRLAVIQSLLFQASNEKDTFGRTAPIKRRLFSLAIKLTPKFIKRILKKIVRIYVRLRQI